MKSKNQQEEEHEEQAQIMGQEMKSWSLDNQERRRHTARGLVLRSRYETTLNRVVVSLRCLTNPDTAKSRHTYTKTAI